MCSKLSERASEDLLDFVRHVHRHPASAHAVEARYLLDKHGLLTPTEETPKDNPYVNYSDEALAVHIEWDSRAAEVWAARNPGVCRQCGEDVSECECRF